MSVIKGRFMYHAYYNNVGEMKRDKSLELGYFVSVIDKQNKRDYKIVDKIEQEGVVYENLDNGLIALSVILSNESTVDTKKPYITVGPTLAQVGMLDKGAVFEAEDTKDVFDLIFYNTWCNVDITTNLSNQDLIRGESHVLRKVTLNITRVTEPIVKSELIVGDERKTFTDEWEMGIYEVNFNMSITDDTQIKLECMSKTGLTYTAYYTIRTYYPSYYSTISKGVEPTTVTIKTMQKTFEDDWSTEFDYVGTELFIAIPPTRKLTHVYDENGIELINEMTTYKTNVYFNSMVAVYSCYYTTPMISNKYPFRIFTEVI